MAIWLLESLPRAAQPPGTCIFTSCVKLTIGLLCIVGMKVGMLEGDIEEGEVVFPIVGGKLIVDDGRKDGTLDETREGELDGDCEGDGLVGNDDDGSPVDVLTGHEVGVPMLGDVDGNLLETGVSLK